MPPPQHKTEAKGEKPPKTEMLGRIFRKWRSIKCLATSPGKSEQSHSERS